MVRIFHFRSIEMHSPPLRWRHLLCCLSHQSLCVYSTKVYNHASAFRLTAEHAKSFCSPKVSAVTDSVLRGFWPRKGHQVGIINRVHSEVRKLIGPECRTPQSSIASRDAQRKRWSASETEHTSLLRAFFAHIQIRKASTKMTWQTWRIPMTAGGSHHRISEASQLRKRFKLLQIPLEAHN